ncbi:hypothetical protein SAMN05216196_105241 [Lutimaribacter pacificus]|uniref:Chemotaxis protein CheA n=1 Tax=Lutimaribacter pacificus TaxID=391948 RepID=A0A1H0JDF4_9RHOB|nr:chemotaxis protein CheA [Lutimaribacter pacificus]SDO41825.1 hypothetical protein SAMN05216196_105241 [Lutimaribacter pacificus]SHK11272.1 hypothetical protein SAMN05444142_103299 [Lutimaribacter pacificus]
MVNTSKILTVSYGTFSCTLEGFDDSFETMKAIAEYFRDLAADDRYFGAEPPTPDAEMLARIAEREVARRVEAREERGGIVLRAADAATAAPAIGTAAAAQEAEAEPEAPAQEPEAAAAPAPVTDKTPEAVEPELAEAEEPEAAEVAEPEAEEPAAELTMPVSEEPEIEHVVPAAAATDENSIAAKLQRIRAVVSRNAAEASDYSEDQHADSFVEPEIASLDAVLTEGADADAPADMAGDDDSILSDILAETAVEDAPEDLAEPAVAAEDTADTLEDELQALAGDAVEETQEHAPEETLTLDDETRIDDTAGDSDEDDVAGILDKLAGLSDDEAEDAPETVATDEDETAASTELDELDDFLSTLAREEDEDAETAQDDAVEETAIAEEPAPLRARVVKMKRADFEAAIAGGQLEAADDEDDWDDDWDALDDSALSPEEEAELQAELAEVEAELEDEDSGIHAFDDEAGDEIDSIFAEAEDDSPDLQERRRAREQLDEAASERDMSRLMAKTNSEMDEPESANRRSAIQHLRAAVAATRADKAAGISAREDTISEAFREDLASVVRPRRPRTEGNGTARPTEQARPAPLKLVAEQRIDAPATPQAPVRPRRVSMADIHEERRDAVHATTDGESFADYAESMGAHDLPEILEAAASYLSFVEGRDQFSRPQLMTRARSAIGDDFSREDGLRSFGQLLRQGKIQKLKGGRFTVSDDIGFQPGERRAG